MIEVVKNHIVIILKGKKMDLNLIKREIKENLDFHDTVDILKESINKIKILVQQEALLEKRIRDLELKL